MHPVHCAAERVSSGANMTRPPFWMPPYDYVNLGITGLLGIVHIWPAKRSRVAQGETAGLHLAWCGAEGARISRDLIPNCIFCLALSR